MTAAQQFENIIANGSIDALIPFWKKFDNKELATLKPIVTKLLAHYSDKGLSERARMVYMATLAISDVREIPNIPSFFFYHFIRYEKAIEFLEIAQSTNLLIFLKQERIESYPAYQFTLELLSRKLIEYDKEFFVQSLIRLTYGFYASTDNVGRIGYSHFEKYVLENEHIYKRDLPLIFEYTTNISYEVPVGDKKTADYSDKPWNNIITKLIELKLWDKHETLIKCLNTLKKDWKQNLINWFKNLYISLLPSNDETLLLQAELCYLLSVQQSSVVNFAVGELKKISLEKDFNAAEFVAFSSAILHRNDCKTAIKSILGIYEKLSQQKAELRSQMCLHVCNALLIDDLSIQEKAIKLIANYAKKDDNDLKDSLLSIIPNIKGDLKKHLTAFLNEEENAIVESEVVEKYEVLPQRFERIRADNVLQIPDNWNDFMFHIGKVLSAENLHLDIEIFLQAFDNLYDTFPADYKTALKPYEKQIENWVDNGTLSLFNAFFKYWLSGESKEKFGKIFNLALLESQFELLYINKIKGNKQPLLSAITHTPHWISPFVFVERLLWYQEHDIEPDMLDKCAAICRVALENCEPALQLAQKLNEKERVFVEFFLGNGAMPALQNDETKDIYIILAARTKKPTSYFPEFENLLCAKYPNVVKPFEWTFNMENRKRIWGNKHVDKWVELSINLEKREKELPEYLYSNDLYLRKDKYRNLIRMNDFDTLYATMPNYSDPLYLKLSYGCTSAEQNLDGTAIPALTKMFQPDFIISPIHIFFITLMTMNVKKENRALATEVLIHLIQNQAIDIELFAQYIGKLINQNYASLQRPLDVLASIKDLSSLHNIALKTIYEGIFTEIFNVKEIPKNTKKLLEDYFDILIKTKQKPAESLLQNLKFWADNATLKKIAKSVLDLGGIKTPVQPLHARASQKQPKVETITNGNTRKFVFNEGTSNKFWQINCSELGFTVTFGKVGTAGQQQTKEFSSSEACIKEVNKIIAEKVKKGYVEQV
jgi:predicted DNA-binding WGR domain protein